MVTRKTEVVSSLDLHLSRSLFFVLCDRSFVVILHGHCVIDAPRPPEGFEQTCRKCYTVNDISFDPNQYVTYTPPGDTTDILIFPVRNHLMASTGNNGFVQLWQDGEKLDNGCCQCDCSFFCPMGSYFAQTSIPRPRTTSHIGKGTP